MAGLATAKHVVSILWRSFMHIILNSRQGLVLLPTSHCKQRDYAAFESNQFSSSPRSQHRVKCRRKKAVWFLFESVQRKIGTAMIRLSCKYWKKRKSGKDRFLISADSKLIVQFMLAVLIAVVICNSKDQEAIIQSYYSNENVIAFASFLAGAIRKIPLDIYAQRTAVYFIWMIDCSKPLTVFVLLLAWFQRQKTVIPLLLFLAAACDEIEGAVLQRTTYEESRSLHICSLAQGLVLTAALSCIAAFMVDFSGRSRRLQGDQNLPTQPMTQIGADLPQNASAPSASHAKGSSEDPEKNAEASVRARNRSYRKRSDEKKRATIAKNLEPEGHIRPPLRRLDQISPTAVAYISILGVGDEFRTKQCLKRRIQEIAECRSITLNYPVNEFDALVAVAEPHHKVDRQQFFIEGNFSLKKECWVVTKVAVEAGIMGVEPSLTGWNRARTAYTAYDLACHVADTFRTNPGFDQTTFVDFFSHVLKHPQKVSPSFWTRVRKIASNLVLGRPDENIKLLPILQRSLESSGHTLTYSTVDGKAMKANFIAVRKAEHAHRKKKSDAKNAKYRSIVEQEDCEDWVTVVRPRFLEENKEMLETIASKDRGYVNYVFLCFKQHKTMFNSNSLLFLINADACFGHNNLDSYLLYIVIGFNSNMQVVPLAYVWVCGGESTESWSRVWTDFWKAYPAMGKKYTIASDGDKGLLKSVQTIFASCVPNHVACAHHRLANLLCLKKVVIDLFSKLTHCRRPSDIDDVKKSEEYKALKPAQLKALESLPDNKQYPAAAALTSASSYGKTTTQAVEGLNGHRQLARSLDILSSILCVCKKEKMTFQLQRIEAHSEKGPITPSARKRIALLQNTSDPVEIDQNANSDYRAWHVVSPAGNRHKVTLLNDKKKAEGSIFPQDLSIEPCTCGVPRRDHFPCSHMISVAFRMCIDENRLVPAIFTTAHWRSQYPEQEKLFTVPTKMDLTDACTDVEGDLGCMYQYHHRQNAGDQARKGRGVQLRKWQKRCDQTQANKIWRPRLNDIVISRL